MILLSELILKIFFSPQIADSLDHLQMITQTIFERIQSHIDENLIKLDNIDNR